jgi:hypothetical protein
MAHCKVQPRAIASSELRVVLGSFPKTSNILVLMAGTRVEPPTISIKSISSGFNSIKINIQQIFLKSSLIYLLASVIKFCNKFLKRTNKLSANFSKSSLFILLETSVSFRKHSIFNGITPALLDIIFLIFSHSALSLNLALIFE